MVIYFMVYPEGGCGNAVRIPPPPAPSPQGEGVIGLLINLSKVLLRGLLRRRCPPSSRLAGTTADKE